GDGRYRSDLTGRPRSHGSWVTRSGHPDDEFHWGSATRRSFIEHTQPDGLATSGPATGTVGRGIREGTPSQPQQNPSHSSTTVTARRMGGPRAPHPCPAVGPTSRALSVRSSSPNPNTAEWPRNNTRRPEITATPRFAS